MTDSEEASRGGLTHLRPDGVAHMVDAMARELTAREATAVVRVECSGAVMAWLSEGFTPKGDVFAVVRVVGIQAIKKTPALLPLAHIVGLHGCEVDVELTDGGVAVHAAARTADRTGAEMEALTAVTVAALAAANVVKRIDRLAVVAEAKIVAKPDGRSGSWIRPEG